MEEPKPIMLRHDWGKRTTIYGVNSEEKDLEKSTEGGESPVFEAIDKVSCILSRAGPEKSCLN